VIENRRDDEMKWQFGMKEGCETDNDRVSRAADGAIPHLC
jgi:hypothetical protein